MPTIAAVARPPSASWLCLSRPSTFLIRLAIEARMSGSRGQVSAVYTRVTACLHGAWAPRRADQSHYFRRAIWLRPELSAGALRDTHLKSVAIRTRRAGISTDRHASCRAGAARGIISTFGGCRIERPAPSQIATSLLALGEHVPRCPGAGLGLRLYPKN